MRKSGNLFIAVVLIVAVIAAAFNIFCLLVGAYPTFEGWRQMGTGEYLACIPGVSILVAFVAWMLVSFIKNLRK